MLNKLFAIMGHDKCDISDLGELYHDFSIFGVRSRQKDGLYALNQRCKAPILSAYIQLAIAKSKPHSYDSVSFAELFCADGYYAMLARHFGATFAIGIDNDQDNHFQHANIIARRLGISNIEFHNSDVAQIDQMPRVDIVANVGGLYHVRNPEDILVKSYQMAKKYLIVQTVVSMTSHDPDYFESPAPGWSWGARYSQESFDKLIDRLGYCVIDRYFNELDGNDRPEDRGSVYYLIEVQAASHE